MCLPVDAEQLVLIECAPQPMKKESASVETQAEYTKHHEKTTTTTTTTKHTVNGWQKTDWRMNTKKMKKNMQQKQKPLHQQVIMPLAAWKLDY